MTVPVEVLVLPPNWRQHSSASLRAATADTGLRAWAGIFAYVAAYDAQAWWRGEPTLSAHWTTWMRSRIGRRVVTAVWASLTVHLFMGFGNVPARKKYR